MAADEASVSEVADTWDVDTDRQKLVEFVQLRTKQIAERNALREANRKAAQGRPDETFFRKLDSSLKKNTAYVKRIKSLTEQQRDSLLRDFEGLNLTKYVAEIVSSLVEAKLKMSDVGAAVEFCCAMFRRYVDFSPLLLDEWRKVLPRKKTDSITNASKLRVDIRFFSECVAVGILDEKEALSSLGCLLGYLVNTDKEEHCNVPIISNFCRFCGAEYAGLIPRDMVLLSQKYNIEVPLPTHFAERHANVRSLLNDYYNSLCEHALRECKELRKIEKQNYKSMHTRGEVHPEAQQRLEDANAVFSKLWTNVETLSVSLNRELPELPPQKFTLDDDETAMMLALEQGGDDGEGSSLVSAFEDEEQRDFYERLPDLQAKLPGILFKESVQAELPQLEENLEELEDKQEEAEVTTTSQDQTEDVESSKDQSETSKAESSQDRSEPDLSASAKAESSNLERETPRESDRRTAEEDSATNDEDAEEKVEQPSINSIAKIAYKEFLDSLANKVNREMIDQAAVDFVTNHNLKSNRRKLVRTLFAVHRNRLDLLPFYSRFVAQLCPIMPDVGTELVNSLTGAFRAEVRRKDQIRVETKIKYVRFIGELVKFRVCPKSEALKCLKMLLFDFRHHNIDMTCALLEVCGYYLFHSPDSHIRTRILLDQMMRKRQHQQMDARYSLMIENAYYASNPPTEALVNRKIKERPPLHEYIRHLLYVRLNKSTIEDVLKQIRKLDWNDDSIAGYAIKCFSQPWFIRFGSLHHLASLLSGIVYYYDFVGVRVVDNILEDIRIGMEINHDKWNQRRFSCVRYLGELYNYRVVDSPIVFSALYSLITFGSPIGLEQISLLDPPEHLFRIRLACALCDTCGHYFDRGSSRKKLDCFLVYLERYYWLKRSAPVWNAEFEFPLEIDNVLHDCIEGVRPKWRFAESLDDAAAAVRKIEDEYRAKAEEALRAMQTNAADVQQNGDAELYRIEEEEYDEDEDDDRRGVTAGEYSGEESTPSGARAQTPGGSSSCLGGAAETSEGEAQSSADEEQAVVKRRAVQHSAEDVEFARALDAMVRDCAQAALAEKVPTTDFAVPRGLRTGKPRKARFEGDEDEEADDESDEGDEGDGGGRKAISFVLMTRARDKAKPALKTLRVPADSDLAQVAKQHIAAEQDEKEQMKKLTLAAQDRMEEEEQKRQEAAIVTSFQGQGRGGGQQQRGGGGFQHPRGVPSNIYSNNW